MLVVNDIIDFNRIEGGDIKVSRSTFILQDLIQELEILFSGSMAHKGVTFEVDISNVDQSAFGDGSRLVLVGDDEKIKRSAINLLSNVSFMILFTSMISIDACRPSNTHERAPSLLLFQL